MLASTTWQRRRLTLPFIAISVLLAGVIGLGIYERLKREHSESDPTLLRQLEAAPLTVATVGTSAPGDWGQWRGPNRDSISLEKGLLVPWPETGPPLLWSTPMGTAYSALSIVGGRAYTMLRDKEDEAIVCLDATSGKELWRRAYRCEFANDRGSGPRSTPAVDQDRVYAVGASGLMHCLRADTGEVVWKHDLLGEFGAASPTWGVSFSPLVVGDLVYTNPGGPNDGCLAAFNKADGKLVWHSLKDAGSYSSPILCKPAGVEQIVFLTSSALVGVSPGDGHEYWRFPWTTSYDVNAATPVCVGDYIFISSGYGAGCALVKIEGSGDKQSAKRVYKNGKIGDYHASNVYLNEHLYGFHGGRLVCMDFRTGLVKWTENDFGCGSIVAADGHLIVLGEHGRLALVEATPQEYREKGSIQLSGKLYWTMPVLANGRLYIRDETQIQCFDVMKH